MLSWLYFNEGAIGMRLNYTHEAIVDLIIQEPTVTTSELAEIFGKSTGWISRVIAADSFNARLAERKAILTDPIISQSINERLKGVAIHAIDIMAEKLVTEESASYALDALGIAATALGVGGRSK
jgi:hypothetical protein